MSHSIYILSIQIDTFKVLNIKLFSLQALYFGAFLSNADICETQY